MPAGTVPNPDPLIGTFVGSYRVERLLGEGGMGAVYELLHPGIGKRLALKLLHPEYAARPQIVQRFFDEARSVNMIGHPNIVDIMDFAELSDGRRYILMEYLEGESLSDTIERVGPMPSDTVAEVGVAICSALEAAHAAGIVHRDLKPENVHLVPRPDNPHYVKVLDFGIAKLSADLHLMPGAATRSGVVMGTPSYMSPEQAMGRTKEIDHRTDVYALGIILYEMLVGEVPFAAESFGDLMLKHLQEPPQSIRQFRPDAPPSWNEVIQVALAKQREDRFQTMGAMAQAIRDAAEGRSITVPTAGHADPTMSMDTAAARAAAASSGGTMTYDQGRSTGGSTTGAPQQRAPTTGAPQQRVPTTGAPQQPAPSTGAGLSSVEAPGKNKKVFLFVTLLIIAMATAVIVMFIVQGGEDTKRTAALSQPTDAGTRLTHAALADAATARAVPTTIRVDAAAVARSDPPPARVVADAGTATTAIRKGTPPTKLRTPRKPRVKGTGKVRIVVAPWAYIKVDGKSRGQTPKTISLSAGTHRIILTNPELSKSVRKKIRIKPGKLTSVRLSWE